MEACEGPWRGTWTTGEGFDMHVEPGKGDSGWRHDQLSQRHVTSGQGGNQPCAITESSPRKMPDREQQDGGVRPPTGRPIG